MRRAAGAVGLALLLAVDVEAQSPSGHVSLFADYLPGRSDTTELRGRVFVEDTLEPSAGLRVRLSGFAEGLLARRQIPMTGAENDAGTDRVTTGIVRVQDAALEWTRGPLDVTAGFARVVWGKLDELQPSDVVNPIDVSRFFFEGRNEARLPVAVVRGRWFATQHTTLEAIYVPVFRRGRFDQLDEPSSPFNLAQLAAPSLPCPEPTCDPAPLLVFENEPPVTLGNAQGGGRLSTTIGRLDWSVSAYRGFEAFALYDRRTGSPGAELPVESRHPRFTMAATDFETVRGAWGFRGEVAAFVEDSFQSADIRIVAGRSVDAGVGFDRRAGDFTVSGTVLFHSERYDNPIVQQDQTASSGRSDVTFIASADRTFNRERFRLRNFGFYNATESTTFLRVIGMMSLRDNVSVEASGGWFAGTGRDLVGRFRENDFLYARVRYDF